MARCIDCAWFPWIPGADFPNLPAIRCHPELKARRWLGDAAQAEHECARYEPKEGIEPEQASEQETMTVAELKQHIAGITDIATLEALLRLEVDGPGRKTAIKVIEERMEELKAGEADDADTGIESGTERTD
ncbi:MAG TPA: hypothetical protein PK728_11785 [Bacillota bacterium]|nr:hypothetical protein [Bacillota bacterium]